MSAAQGQRVESLDLIRGVAVLGILAINISGFANPPQAVLTPHLPTPGSTADEAAFAVSFLLFEGKMRALFSLLFGASLVLLDRRADANGLFGDVQQARRIGWLAVFGLAHFYLLWWGDILFTYAVIGVIALFMRELSTRTLVIVALATFVIWHVTGGLFEIPQVIAEEQVRLGKASAAQARDHAAFMAGIHDYMATETELARSGFLAMVSYRLGVDTLQPLFNTFNAIGETLPLMLLGMALCRTGFFSGGWTRAQMRATAWAGIVTGLALTGAILAWVWTRDFPIAAMQSAFFNWTAIPHLLMAIGYAALLVLACPAIAATWAGKRLVAAGRMAFTVYIGTSLAMTAIFYGWGLGLFGDYGHARQWLFVVGAWLLIMALCHAWLQHFRKGPLEWLWRSLVNMEPVALRR